jgi:Transposase DDE domain/Transposase domain (DUF772)
MCFAYELARRCLPRYSCKFSRKDYTLAQLFACLIVREHQRKSYRGIEALLRDSRHWCRRIGMKRVPDHNTLCRAFHALLSGSRVERLMDRLTGWMACANALGTTCAIDSTLYDTHHRSRHYEQRCRQFASSRKNTANSRRSRAARRTPKLSVSVDTRCHLILAARTRSGMGSDAPDWAALLRDSKRRVPDLQIALADAGFDSHQNHGIARDELKMRSWIKTGIGRPSDKPPKSRYRRLMRKKLSGSQKGKPYGQRAQVETVNSMMKRNLGDHLRARTPEGRRKEQMLKVITHNLMILLSRDHQG